MDNSVNWWNESEFNIRDCIQNDKACSLLGLIKSFSNSFPSKFVILICAKYVLIVSKFVESLGSNLSSVSTLSSKGVFFPTISHLDFLFSDPSLSDYSFFWLFSLSSILVFKCNLVS